MNHYNFKACFFQVDSSLYQAVAVFDRNEENSKIFQVSSERLKKLAGILNCRYSRLVASSADKHLLPKAPSCFSSKNKTTQITNGILQLILVKSWKPQRWNSFGNKWFTDISTKVIPIVVDNELKVVYKLGYYWAYFLYLTSLQPRYLASIKSEVKFWLIVNLYCNWETHIATNNSTNRWTGK